MTRIFVCLFRIHTVWQNNCLSVWREPMCVCVCARVCMWAANVQMFIRRQWLFVNYCSLDVLYLSASLRSAFTFQYFENESKNGFIYMTITTINCRRIDFFFFRHKRLHEVEHFLSHIFFFSQIHFALIFSPLFASAICKDVSWIQFYSQSKCTIISFNSFFFLLEKEENQKLKFPTIDWNEPKQNNTILGTSIIWFLFSVILSNSTFSKK